MSRRIQSNAKARPDIVLAESRVRPAVLALVRVLSGFYLHLGLGFTGVQLRNARELIDAFAMSQEGKRRVFLAFRHPYGDEPQLLSWLFLRGLRSIGRRQGIAVPKKAWARFVHGYEVPRWSGPLVRFLLPRMGALPVHHAKMDREGLGRIKEALFAGPWPIALAPEGQVSYAADRVPRLENGTARIGIDVAERLARDGGGVELYILPLSVRYLYGPGSVRSLERLTRRCERMLFSGTEARAPKAMSLPLRLARVRDRALSLAQSLYGLSVKDADTRARAETLVEQAVSASERALKLGRGAGGVIERVYRVRQEGWDRIFRSDRVRGPRPGKLERSLQDRAAAEAWLAMRHMELADLGWYFSGLDHARLDGLEPDLLAEYAQNVWDLCNRLDGGAISGRIALKPRRAIVLASAGLNLSELMRQCQGDKKAAAAKAHEALRVSFEQAIKELFHG